MLTECVWRTPQAVSASVPVTHGNRRWCQTPLHWRESDHPRRLSSTHHDTEHTHSATWERTLTFRIHTHHTHTLSQKAEHTLTFRVHIQVVILKRIRTQGFFRFQIYSLSYLLLHYNKIPSRYWQGWKWWHSLNVYVLFRLNISIFSSLFWTFIKGAMLLTKHFQCEML